MSEVKAAPDLRENKMRTMPIGKLLFTMALPLAISMLVQAFYNVVDSIYVSRVSESAVTALSLAFPDATMIFIVFSPCVPRVCGARHFSPFHTSGATPPASFDPAETASAAAL